jgi:hypothetical protein
MVTLHEILSLEMQRMFLYIQYSCDFDSDFDNILFIYMMTYDIGKMILEVLVGIEGINIQ